MRNKRDISSMSIWSFLDVTVVTVTTAAHSRSVQLSTAVRFRCGPAGSIEGATSRRTGDLSV